MTLRANLHAFDRGQLHGYLDHLLAEVARLEQRLVALGGVVVESDAQRWELLQSQVVDDGGHESMARSRAGHDAGLDEIAGRTVLVVDDEPLFRRMLVDGLAAELPFVDVLMARNGQDALDVLLRCPVDLVVTDVRMPVLDGMSLVAQMVDRGIHKPVVMMTAFGARSFELDARRHGVIAVLDKPVDFPMLVEICTSTLRSWSRGTIEGVTLCGLLQLLEMERRSCTVRVFGRGERGLVAMKDGDVVACSAGAARGLAALAEIVGWEAPRIELCPLGEYEPSEEPIPLHVALLEGARRSDEARRDMPATAPLAAPKPAATPGGGRRLVLQRQLEAGMELEGAIGFAIVDELRGACLCAQAHEGFPIERAAVGSIEVVAAKRRVTAALGEGGAIEDIVITLAEQHHVIVPASCGTTFLYLVLDRARCNLALARHRLMGIVQSLRP